MWNNAGLSTSALITAYSPANGMVHHTVANIFVSTKLRDLGPKSSPARTFWRMVATCIRYQPPADHLLRDMTTFSLASVKTPCVGTGFLGLACPLFPCNSLEEIPELPQILSICSVDLVSVIGGSDALRLAVATPLPPAGILETVLLSLKEGQLLSESTVRRLRRKEAELRAAAAEGRPPLSEYKRRKQKRMAARAAIAEAASGSPSEQKAFGSPELGPTSAIRAGSPSKDLNYESAVQLVETFSLIDHEHRRVSVEDVEKLAASASVRRRRMRQVTAPRNQP